MTEQSTRHLVDPGLLRLVDRMPVLPLNQELLPALRTEAAKRLPFTHDPAIAERVTTSHRVVPGPVGAPDVTVMMHDPRTRALPSGAILHIHGGGYVMGDARSYTPVHQAMASALDCTIVSVEYRLAPETKAPGAVEDCYAALAWLHGSSAALGVDADRIGVMGESAGGGLAAALALLARDRGEYRLAFQHLISPMLDDRTCATAEPNRFTGEFIWTPDKNQFGWASLLGTVPGSSDVSPYAAPARASDLTGLPPAYLAVGSLDLFVDENIDYAQRLIRAGVPTELHVYPGAFHGFQFDQAADVTMKSTADSSAALAKALARTAAGGGR